MRMDSMPSKTLVRPSVSSPSGLALMTTALQGHHGAAVQLRAAGNVTTDGLLLPCEAQLGAGDRMTGG